MTDPFDQANQTNNFIDKVLAKIKALFQKVIPAATWDRLGLGKTWWAFIALVVVIGAYLLQTSLDSIYFLLSTIIKFLPVIAFILTLIILLRALGVWSKVLAAILNFIGKFK